MNAPLAPALQRYFGHPVVTPGVAGLDMLGAEGDFVSDYVEGLQLGYDDIGARHHAQRKMAMRRLSRCGPVARPQMPMPMPMPTDDDVEGLGYFGADDDEWDPDEVSDDEEIEALGEDDEEEFGADGDELVSGTVDRLERKIARLEAKKAKWQQRLQQTRRPRKRKRIMARLARIDRKIEKKRNKLAAKRDKLAAKLGISPAALAAASAAAGAGAGAGAVAAGLGIPASQLKAAEEAMARGDVRRAEGIMGVVRTIPEEGELVPVAFQLTGSNVAVGSVAAGAGLREVSINMQTPTIAYAGFKVVGVWVELAVQGGNAGDVLVNCLLNNVTVDGGINLLYTDVSVAAVGVLAGRRNADGFERSGGPIMALRDNPDLPRTSTAELTATFRQEITNAAAINFSFQAALLCRRIADLNATRF